MTDAKCFSSSYLPQTHNISKIQFANWNMFLFDCSMSVLQSFKVHFLYYYFFLCSTECRFILFLRKQQHFIFSCKTKWWSLVSFSLPDALLQRLCASTLKVLFTSVTCCDCEQLWLQRWGLWIGTLANWWLIGFLWEENKENQLKQTSCVKWEGAWSERLVWNNDLRRDQAHRAQLSPVKFLPVNGMLWGSAWEGTVWLSYCLIPPKYRQGSLGSPHPRGFLPGYLDKLVTLWKARTMFQLVQRAGHGE